MPVVIQVSLIQAVQILIFIFPFCFSPVTVSTVTYIKGQDICSAAVAIGQHWLNCQKQPGDCSHFTASVQLWRRGVWGLLLLLVWSQLGDPCTPQLWWAREALTWAACGEPGLCWAVPELQHSLVQPWLEEPAGCSRQEPPAWPGLSPAAQQEPLLQTPFRQLGLLRTRC